MEDLPVDEPATYIINLSVMSVPTIIRVYTFRDILLGLFGRLYERLLPTLEPPT